MEQPISPSPATPESKTVKTSDQLYLDGLEFDPSLRKSWLNFFVTNFRVVLLLILMITSAGLYAFFTLPRESNPEVKIPIASVVTVLPGASPSDIEELVTKKIETGLSGLKGVKKITSNSLNNVSSIVVEFEASANLDDSIRSLRDKVNTVKSTLSSDVKDPIVTEVSLDDQPIISLAMTGPYDGFTMRQYAEKAKDELEKIPGVREVLIAGGNEKEFQVAYSPEKLLFYHLSTDQANRAIASTNIAIPAGTFDSKIFQYSVRSDSKVYTPEAIAAIPITQTAEGGTITIGNVADVSIHAIKKTTLSRLSIKGSVPQDAITLSIVKRTGASVIDTTEAARSTMDTMVKSFGQGVHYDVSLDLAKQIKKDFDQLEHDFVLTLVLVFGILFIIVGLKEAFVAGLAIPLVFFATFVALLGLGISLNFLSLFSLILSLGLLVDDAIVVVSATKQYLKIGKFTPEEAVLLVLRDFKVVLTTTTLTTVWAFLPLLFSTGIIGEYIRSIPITVSITLISSLFIALMINHPLAAVLERLRLTKKFFFGLEALLIVIAGITIYSGGILNYIIGGIAVVAVAALARWYEKNGKAELIKNEILSEQEWQSDALIKQKLLTQGNHAEAGWSNRLMHGILHFDRFLPIYERNLRKILATKRSRRLTLAAVTGMFVFSVILPVLGIVRSEFFPKTDSDYVYIDISTPIGYKLAETDKIMKTVETKILAYKEIANYSSFIGRISPVNANGNSSEHVGYIAITLKDKSERKGKSYEFADRLRADLNNIPQATITVSSLSGGPPSGAAFQARISGDDLAVLTKIVNDLQPKLAAVPGVVDIDNSLKNSAPDYTFVLDPVKLAQNNLNAAYVGSVLRLAISGTEISTVIENNKEVKIVARFGSDSLSDLAAIQNLQILNQVGQPVYLKDVATIELKPAVDGITRIDQKRTVLLSANVSAGTTGPAVLQQFQKNIADYRLPSGYAISYGGENEQNQESVLSIIRAMMIAMLLIVSTLIIQFNSFRKAFIVLVTIPLALIGVFVGLAVFGVPLSFPGLIGILALFGIVVKNAIILMDKINLNLKSGIPFIEAIVDAGKSRLEAIFITSICTIFGILPITLSNETWTALGSAVIFGLMLSSFLTLFIVPTMFVTLLSPKIRAENN